MLDKNNEVFFGEYCKTCKYKNYSETDCPCSECIAEPVNLYSHKPIKWEGADGVFSGPPPRPDHAYQRAVKYVPEKRKDKEKAIARQNIEAEYTGNKVQSIDSEVTDDQYPSATAVKKALENKIDAPQVAQVGEVLTVEEIGEDGKPKKWKTQTVETAPPDWMENVSNNPGFVKNRTHYKQIMAGPGNPGYKVNLLDGTHRVGDIILLQSVTTNSLQKFLMRGINSPDWDLYELCMLIKEIDNNDKTYNLELICKDSENIVEVNTLSEGNIKVLYSEQEKEFLAYYFISNLSTLSTDDKTKFTQTGVYVQLVGKDYSEYAELWATYRLYLYTKLSNKYLNIRQDPKDWNENDPTKPGYIENRTHYFKVTKTEIGSILFKATSSSALVMENPEDTKLVRAGITKVANEHSNIVEAIVDGNPYKFYVKTTMGVTMLIGVDDDSNGWAYDGPAGMNRQFEIGENVSLVVGNKYNVMFYWRNEFCKTLDEMYFPKTIFTQNNSPVKFGTNEYGDIIGSTIQGIGTVAQGPYSHAEGAYTKARGEHSHAEGNSTKSQKSCSHAEGFMTTANGDSAHAEGSSTQANHRNTHAEGDHTIASGECSHAEGYNTIASGKEQHAQGKYNIEDTVSAHIVGNGESNSKRSNAYTLDWEGNAWFSGDVYVHSTSGTNKDDGSVRLVTEDQLTSCVRLLIRPKKNNDGTITYSANFPALFVYYEIFKGRPIDDGNSVECCLASIEGGNLTVLNYTGMSIDQNSDGNIVLTVRFSSYTSGKQISAEIKDTVSEFGTDNENILSTVVTVTENSLVSCSMTQELTHEQQELAKRNIGAGALRKVYYWDVTNDTLEAPNSVMRCAEYGDTCICLNQTSLPHGMVGPVLVIYGEISYGRRQATAFDGSNATWTFSVNLSDYSYSTPIKKSGIPTPTTAQVGQIVKVKSVDADGKIAETEAVDMPTVPNDYELVFQETVAEDVGAYSRDTDKDGNPFSLTDVMVIIFTKPFAESTNSAGRALGFLPTSRWGHDNVSCDIGSSISSANTNSVGRYNVVFVKVVNGYQVVTRAYESQNTTNVFGILVRQTKAGNEMFRFHTDATKLMQLDTPQGNITCVKIVGYTNPLVSAGTIVALYKKKGT